MNAIILFISFCFILILISVLCTEFYKKKLNSEKYKKQLSDIKQTNDYYDKQRKQNSTGSVWVCPKVNPELIAEYKNYINKLKNE